MPAFMIRERCLPGEVRLQVARCGTMASIHAPTHLRTGLSICDMKLSTALLVASSLARELGTDVVIVDDPMEPAG